MDSQRQAAGDAGDRPLWFNPPDGEDNRRRALTRAARTLAAEGRLALLLLLRDGLLGVAVVGAGPVAGEVHRGDKVPEHILGKGADLVDRSDRTVAH